MMGATVLSVNFLKPLRFLSSMPRGREKSGHFRKVMKRTPGGKTVKRYLRRLPQVAKCANCKKALHGIPRMTRQQAKGAAKSTKTVARPYGGNLCSKCMREKLKA
jgi:large subunit ribosomal protein L34e